MSAEAPEHRACRHPDLDEAAIRADERRRMDHAITWDTTCFGCADRLDALITERWAGYDEALRDVERTLLRLDPTPGVAESLAVVRRLLTNPPQRRSRAPRRRSRGPD